MIARPEQ
jgi:hypothetical protein